MLIISTTYSDLTNTNFPDSLDDWLKFLDITLSDLTLVQSYYSYYDAGDIENANLILTNNPTLKQKIINADNLNKFRDAIIALERFYLNDIQSYLVELVKYKGDWVSSTKYNKYDVVNYAISDAIQSYMGVSTSIPIGTLPTNDSYYIPITLRGQQGVSGIGMSPRGYWSNIVQYYQYDCVAYNNILWYAKQDNLGKVPQQLSDYWGQLMTMPQQIITDSIQPSGQNPNDIWFEKDENNGIKIHLANADGTYTELFPETTNTQVKFADGTYLKKPIVKSITLLSANWIEDTTNHYWTQSITDSNIVDGVKVDITFDATNIKQLSEDSSSIIIRNNSGTATAYAFNNIPSIDVTGQIEVRAVSV